MWRPQIRQKWATSSAHNISKEVKHNALANLIANAGQHVATNGTIVLRKCTQSQSHEHTERAHRIIRRTRGPWLYGAVHITKAEPYELNAVWLTLLLRAYRPSYRGLGPLNCMLLTKGLYSRSKFEHKCTLAGNSYFLPRDARSASAVTIAIVGRPPVCL